MIYYGEEGELVVEGGIRLKGKVDKDDEGVCDKQASAD